MAKQSIKQKLEDAVICSQIVRKRDGTKHFVFRKGYFYKSGTPEMFAESVTNKLTRDGIEHTVIDSGDNWAPFKGGASVAKQSHFWVEVKVEE